MPDNIQLPRFSVLSGDNSLPFAEAPTGAAALAAPADLAAQPAFSRVFQPGRVTLGLMVPFKGYPDGPEPDIADLGELAKCAEELGFAALWVRDVPFLEPAFGDVGQGLDAMVTLGLLAAHTQRIALGTAGLIAPLRLPAHIAKAAASVDRLTRGRFLLGLCSGDRPLEYQAFGAKFERRAEVFRENWRVVKALLGQSFPRVESKFYGRLDGTLDTVPKPCGRVPMVTIGRARQELQWLAQESDAWIWHGVNPEDTGRIVQTLAALGDGKTWRPFGYANFIELDENPDAPMQMFNNIYLRGGSRNMARFWQQQGKQGLAHVVVNLKPTRRPALEALRDLAHHALPILEQG